MRSWVHFCLPGRNSSQEDEKRVAKKLEELNSLSGFRSEGGRVIRFFAFLLLSDKRIIAL